MIVTLDGLRPRIAEDSWIESTAQVIGDVEIGPKSSLWYHVVVRGDVGSIRIGRETNIQDHSVVHVTGGRFNTTIGDRVTVGHRVVLHGCRVGDLALVGIGAIVLDGAEIGEAALVGAGSLVTPGTVIPPRMLAIGSPARPVRELKPAELEQLRESAANYVANAERYSRGVERG